MATEDAFTEEEAAEFAQHGVTVPVQPRDDQGRFVSLNDTTTASAGADTQPAPAGADTVAAPAGDDSLTGAAGEDTLPAPAGADTTTAPDAVQPPAGYVPHQALHAERVKNQELARQMAQLQARTNALLTSQQPAQTQIQLPDPEVDPFGYMRGLQDRLEQFEAQRNQESQMREINSRIEQDEATFSAYTPDYAQASEYYVQSRAKELLTFYSPDQARQIMENEVREVARQSWARGVPAAASIYSLAQARGYQPGQQPAQPAPAPRPAPAAVVDSVTRGQQQSRSLSTPAGGTPAELNAEALLNMSDEEFEAYLKLGQKGANERFARAFG